MAPDTFQGHQIGGARTDPVSAQGDNLGQIVWCPDPTAGNDHYLVPYAFFLQKTVNFGNGVFQRHGNIFLGDVGRRTCAPIAAVEMNDMGSGIITPHCHHIHIRGRGDFDRDQGLGIHRLYPVHMLLVVFHRIDAVERERRKERASHHCFPHTGNPGRDFIP